MPFSVSLTHDTSKFTPLDPVPWEEWLQCIGEEADALEATNPLLLYEEIIEQAIEACKEKGPPAGWDTTEDTVGSGLKETGEGWDYTNGAASALTPSDPLPAGYPPGEYHVVITQTVPPVETMLATYCNPGRDTAKGVVLLFSPGRTKIESVVFENADAKRTQGFQKRFPSRCGGDHLAMFRTPVRSGEAVKALISFVGDPPHLRQAVFLVDRSEARVPPTAQPFDPIPTVVDCNAVAGLNVFRTTFSAALDYRDAQLLAKENAGVGDPEVLRDQQFFAALDRIAHPDVAAIEREKAAVAFQVPTQVVDGLDRLESLSYHLWLRLRKRVRTVSRKAYVPRMNAKASGLDRYIELRTGGLLLAHLFERFYGSDLKRIGEAFERFAGGELRVFDSHGVPNGINFFTFGELAVALSELGGLGSDEIVVRLLPVWTRAAEIYARCYHLPYGPRTIAAYTIRDNPTGSRHFSASQKSVLVAAHAALGLAPDNVADQVERFSEVVTAALYGQFQGENPLKKELLDQPGDPTGRTVDCENPCPRSSERPAGGAAESDESA